MRRSLRRLLTLAVALLLLPIGQHSRADSRSAPGVSPEVFEERITTDDGVELYLRVVGSEGQTVVVPLATFVGDRLDALARGRRLALYDPRGRGRSGSPSPEDMSLDHQVSDLEAVRRHLGAERLSVIGWSGLGMEVFVWALRHPGRVERIVQLAPVPPRQEPYMERMGENRRARRDQDAIEELVRRRDAGAFEDDPAGYCRAVNALTWPADFADPGNVALVPDVCRYPSEWPVNLGPRIGTLLESFAGYDWRGELSRMTAPRLVIHGAADPIPLEGNREWVAGRPEARILVVEGAGHWPIYEKHEEVVRAIDRFLAGEWPERAEAAPRPGLCTIPPGELEEAISVVHEGQRNVGLAAVLRKDGEMALFSQRGQADLDHGVPVGPDTRFGIASITKLFTAVTLLRLAAAGEVDLDAPIQEYLPGFPVKREGKITLRLLATHRSGLPHPQERTPEFFARHYETAREALEVFADVELVATPGEERVYSSSNYNLLAAVVEAVRREPFPEVVEQEVLRPLGLADTRFDDVLEPIPHRSRRYSFYHPWTYAVGDRLLRVPTWDYSFNPGGGNMLSTAGDLVRFGEALHAPGLLSEEAFATLYDETWFGKQGADGDPNLVVTGSNPGVQAGLAIHPQRGTAAAVLSNTWGVGARSADMVVLPQVLTLLCEGEAEGYRLLGGFQMRAGSLESAAASLRRAMELGPDEREEVERELEWVATLRRARESSAPVPVELLHSYAGEYGRWSIQLEDRALIVRLGDGSPHTLDPASTDTFVVGDGPMLRFRFADENGDGSPEILEVHRFDGEIERVSRSDE